jgi:prepilin-type N-terminal cleavage/methylation domain-containing protein
MLLYYVRKKDREKEGFTLIEVLTAVIILGVLAAIAAPNFLGLLNKNRLERGLSDVEGAIREAQRLAIRRGKTCSIRLTTASGSSIPIVEVTPHGSDAYVGCLLSERELPSDVRFSLSSGGSLTVINSSSFQDLAFSGKGNPDLTSQKTIVVSHPNVSVQKCLRIEGVLGNILTGEYVSNECKAQ